MSFTFIALYTTILTFLNFPVNLIIKTFAFSPGFFFIFLKNFQIFPGFSFKVSFKFVHSENQYGIYFIPYSSFNIGCVDLCYVALTQTNDCNFCVYDGFYFQSFYCSLNDACQFSFIVSFCYINISAIIWGKGVVRIVKNM